MPVTDPPPPHSSRLSSRLSDRICGSLRRSTDVSDPDSSDDDRAKVVKSAKDKRLEELEGTVKAIENGEKINYWGSISAGMLGHDILGVPKSCLIFYLRIR